MEKLLKNSDSARTLKGWAVIFSFIFFLLSLLLACSKPNASQPEPQRTQIEVTENITEDMIWESGRIVFFLTGYGNLMG